MLLHKVSPERVDRKHGGEEEEDKCVSFLFVCLSETKFKKIKIKIKKIYKI